MANGQTGSTEFREQYARARSLLPCWASCESVGGASLSTCAAKSCSETAANRPRSVEGAQVWDLVQGLNGQLRLHGTSVVGFDFSAAFQMARALGVNKMAVAEFLPAIEAVMVRETNERMEGSGG